MGVLKRACMIVYALISLIAVGVLFVIAANPFGVAQSIYRFGMFMPYQWPLITELVLLSIFALVMLIVLGIGIFAPSQKRHVRVALESGEVYIERNALEASVRNTVAQAGGALCHDVDVLFTKRGTPHLDVEVEVSLRNQARMQEMGAWIQHQVKENLEHLCGVEVREVTVTFAPVQGTHQGITLPAQN